MKTIKLLVVFLVALFAFVACQKEFIVDGGMTGGLAAGTLKDSLGDCQPVLINGIYIQDSIIKADSNFVIVQVNLNSPVVSYNKTDV